MLPSMTWLYQDAISFRSPVTMPVYWLLVASGKWAKAVPLEVYLI
jgi:hypothetical protein